MRTVQSNGGRTGRPRGFDMEAALRAALKLFWAKGYEGTTVTDLTWAMGLNMSSMYAAFGDKESLFRRAAALYAQDAASMYERSMSLPRLLDSLTDIFHSVVAFLNRPGYPPGCLTVVGALASSSQAAPVQQLLLAMRTKGQRRLAARVKQAQQEGELSTKFDGSAFARHTSTVLWGMMVQSASGATKTQLRTIAATSIDHMAADLAPYLCPSRFSRQSQNRDEKRV